MPVSSTFLQRRYCLVITETSTNFAFADPYVPISKQRGTSAEGEELDMLSANKGRDSEQGS